MTNLRLVFNVLFATCAVVCAILSVKYYINDDMLHAIYTLLLVILFEVSIEKDNDEEAEE